MLCRFDQTLNSFMPHPSEDWLCVVTCMDRLIELNINNDSHNSLMNYRDLVKAEGIKKMSLPSYAEYLGFDDLFLIWLQGIICVVQRDATIVSQQRIKPVWPNSLRIRINRIHRTCVIACRNEILCLSVPSLKVLATYRDTVNDFVWRSVDLIPTERILLSVPDSYVLDGPAYYLLFEENSSDVQISRSLRQQLLWGFFHPSGRSIIFCTDRGELIQFLRNEKGAVWNVSVCWLGES